MTNKICFFKMIKCCKKVFYFLKKNKLLICLLLTHWIMTFKGSIIVFVSMVILQPLLQIYSCIFFCFLNVVSLNSHDKWIYLSCKTWCQHHVRRDYFLAKLVESIFQSMLTRFFYQRWLGFVWPTPARVFSKDINQNYF